LSVADLFRLDGQVAIVTGASSGLGAAAAVGLAEAGADVVLGARRTDRLGETARLVEATGRRAVVLGTDVADPEACERLAQLAVAELGRLDVLVNNAGIGTAVVALRETPDQFRQVLDVNLHGCYWMAQAAARAMTGGGSIVNVSSVLAVTTTGLPQAAYSASKAALLGLTRDLAQQWTGRRGIRVNAVLPGYFSSEMGDRHDPDYLADLIERRILSGRLGEVDEIAAAVLFLASPAAGYMTGSSVLVDGGVAIT
jgi:NAD(P)-dependent dehydrogenase (short-subunit alcohol dehydrogenase family)